MARKKISELTAATTPDLDAVIPIVQSGQTLKYKPALPLNVRAFGASPSATAAANTAAIQAAMTAASARGGGVVYVPIGSHPCNALTLTVSNVTLEGEGDASILDFSASTGTVVAISVTGSQASGTALSGNATEGSADLDVSGSGFSDGDWAKVYSEATTGATNIKKGEIVRINSASTMTLYDPLCDSYATADTATVAKITFVENVAIRKLKLIGPDDDTVTMSGILLDRVRNAVIENVTCDKMYFYGVGIQDCVSTRISACHFQRCKTATLAYGVAVFNASQDTSIVGCTGWDLRHLVTHGGFTARHGVPRRSVTSACVASQVRQSGFDTHAGAEDISFVGNTCIGSDNDGITFEGASGVLVGNTTIDCAGRGININNQTAKALSVTVSGNKISGKGTLTDRGIRLLVTANYETFDGVVISGNVITDCRFGIDVDNAQTGRVTGLAITGNSFRRCAQSGDAVISITHAEDAVVSANNIYENISSSDGVSLSDVTGGVVTGNVVGLPNSGACRGIRLINSSNIVVDGNRCSGGSNSVGIALDSNCSDCTIGTNDTRDCTTPVDISTGSGHEFRLRQTAYSSSEDVASAASSANIDIALPVSTFSVFRVQVDGEDANGSRCMVRGRVTALRSGSGSPVVSGFKIEMAEVTRNNPDVTPDTWLLVTPSASSNNLRVNVRNDMGADCHMTIRVWEVDRLATVEDS